MRLGRTLSSAQFVELRLLLGGQDLVYGGLAPRVRHSQLDLQLRLGRGKRPDLLFVKLTAPPPLSDDPGVGLQVRAKTRVPNISRE